MRDPDQPFPDFPKRVSFLMDPEGKVRKTYEVADVAGHAAEVLKDIKAA